MASYDKYDERLESLVIETKTHWDSSLSSLPEGDRSWLSNVIHQTPQLAEKVHYERSHTGFTREITVTVQDVQRLYQQKMAR